MKAQKYLVFILFVLLLTSLLAFPVFALEEPVLEYEVTIDGLETKEAELGDIVTVTLHLQRTDSDKPLSITCY